MVVATQNMEYDVKLTYKLKVKTKLDLFGYLLNLASCFHINKLEKSIIELETKFLNNK